MSIDRRSLIRGSCLTAAAFAARPAWAAAGIFRNPRESRAASSDTILVIIQLGGGNDGLNTVIPFSDPAYVANRTRIGLTESQVLKLDARTGLHPSLANLRGYLDSGRLAIIQNVGYPRPDLSHFRSDDIWEKGTVTPETERTGWLGRALDQMYPHDVEAIHAVPGSDVPAFQGTLVTSPTIDGGASPRGDQTQMDALKALFAPVGDDNRDFIGHVGELAVKDAEIMQAAFDAYSTDIEYPDGGLPLQQVAALIASDSGARFFWTGQGSYDTHTSQLGSQGDLLQSLDLSLDAFYRDLVAHGQDQRVVIMTYSEFGRRVEDNDSGGTDHGTSAPMFILGSRVKGGLYGEPPSLTDLDPDGNLKFSTDFRQVYASVLGQWIDTDPVPVLGGVEYPTISFL